MPEFRERFHEPSGNIWNFSGWNRAFCAEESKRFSPPKFFSHQTLTAERFKQLMPYKRCIQSSDRNTFLICKSVAKKTSSNKWAHIISEIEFESQCKTMRLLLPYLLMLHSKLQYLSNKRQCSLAKLHTRTIGFGTCCLFIHLFYTRTRTLNGKSYVHRAIYAF